MTRRILSGFCALVLILTLAAFPVRARAMASAAMAAVGTGVVIAAFLSLCKVYPYAQSPSISFDAWENDSLRELWNQYAGLNAATPFNNVKGYAMNGAIVVGSKIWSELRGFAQWLREKFDVADNQESVALGEITFKGYNGLAYAPYFSSVPTVPEIVANGIYIGNWSMNCYAGASTNSVLLALDTTYGPGAPFFISLHPFTSYFINEGSVVVSRVSSSGTYWGETYYFTNYNTHYLYQMPSDIFQTSDVTEILQRFLSGSGYPASELASGITADTGTVAIPDELPEEAEFAGMRVAGVHPGVAVEDIIESGVIDRERPVVTQAPVEIAEGLDANAETGEVTEEGAEAIVITMPLAISDYSIPSLSSVFPFSIPWDIARVWQALDAEPRFPLQDFSMTVPPVFGLWTEPQTVRFSLDAFSPQVQESMDSVASVVRSFLLILACIAFLVFISQFIKF